MDYQDFLIEIDSDSKTKSTFRGQSKTSKLELSDSINKMIGSLAKPEESRNYSRGQIKDFGVKLWKALFREGIQAQFENVMQNVDNKHGLRILLKTAPEFANYPWETMAYNDVHLATDIKTPLLRIYLGDNRYRNLRDKLPKIMLILSNASGEFYVETAMEKQIIEEALKDNQGIAKPLEIVEVATLNNIKTSMSKMTERGEPVNIIHFVGHGRFEDDTGYLALRKEGYQGGLEKADDETIKQVFLNQVESLGLFVLNSCSTAMVSNQFSGLVPKLLSRIPAVVAMRQPISNVAALSFTEGLYQNLSVDRIEATVQIARNSMYTNQKCRKIDFSIPVLYLGWGAQPEGTAPKIFAKNLYDDTRPAAPIGTSMEKRPSQILGRLLEVRGTFYQELKKKIDLLTDKVRGKAALQFFMTNTDLWEHAFTDFRRELEGVTADVCTSFPNDTGASSDICNPLLDELDALSLSIRKGDIKEINLYWANLNKKYGSLETYVTDLCVKGVNG